MVIFTDLSEVLISGFYGTEKIMEHRFGSDLAKKFWERHLKTTEEFKALLRGEITEDAYWSYFSWNQDWPTGINENVFKSAFTANLKNTIDGTLDVYERLAASPLSIAFPNETIISAPKIYIVSDHIREREEEVRKNHPRVFEAATEVFWSFNFGKIKQDPGFFEKLLKKTGYKPEEVLFIDDSADNVCAARRAKISAIHFQNAEQLEGVLRRCGFKFSAP